MDTREKIVCSDKALDLAKRLRSDGKKLTVFVGHFDPVLAGHARRLAAVVENSTATIAVVADPPHPILSARARAELVAALAAVDYVVLPGEMPVVELVIRLEASRVVHGEAEDVELTRELIQHVQSRKTAS